MVVIMDIIFSDFFDTLVHRVIPPEDVKKLWSKLLSSDLKLNVDIYALRFKIEAQLCAENFAKYQENEFRYNDMCTLLWVELEYLIDLELSAFLELCRNLELRIEKKVQYLSYKNIEFIRDAKNNGVEVYLVSDFYFDRELFSELLEFHQLSSLFNNVFISSEHIASKRSGRLYQKIKEELNLDIFSDALMLGDNKLADVENAALAGLTSKWSDATKHHSYYRSAMPDDELNNLINKFNAIYLPQNNVIYPEVALVLHLFILKLHAQLVSLHVTDVLFMAREGEFLKRLFDQHTCFVGSGIHSHYFYVSRRATFLPSLLPLEQEDFHILFRQYVNISPQEFLFNLNFTSLQIDELKYEFSFELNQRINDLPSSSEFLKLKQNKLFAKYYEFNRCEQKANINKHILNMNVDVSDLYVVDVGWKGTIQDNLAKILSSSKINGYYLGLNLTTEENSRSLKHGLLFNPKSAWNTLTYDAVYNECTSLFEVLLGASHGSTKRYLSNGDVELLENDIELKLFNNTISEMQNQMSNYIKLIDSIFIWSDVDLASIERFIGHKYANFIFAPTSSQLEIYNNLYHVESFGVHETTLFVHNQASFFNKLLSFIKNPRLYINTAFWPAQKLFVEKLKFLIPLYKFYRMRKIAK